jgi:maltose-binding protein MalE
MKINGAANLFYKEIKMKVTIEVVIETDEAEAEELAIAVKNALDILEMQNGDSLYLGDQSVVVKDVCA